MRFGEKIFAKFQAFYNDVVEKPLLTSVIVLLLITIIVGGLSLRYYINDFDGFWPQILAEAHGMIFDIAVIGILLFWLNQNGEIRQRIRTYKDEIDDFRLWESDEAAFRTVGNLKRLNRHGIFEINLVNCYLARTNLNYVNLKGSNLNSANISNSSLIESNLENTRLNQTNLENSNLNQVNLRGAYASGSNFNDAFLIKAQLEGAFLIKTSFRNAFLMEANLKNSYLMGADLENASLYKADLRGVKGLTIEQLAKAKTLYLAQFDDELFDEIKMNIPELVGS
ncbi:MAG TPA: pentapeptide repeat-containing protein [Cyclobacteriaceae bacterium]|nr:pentapeptide repeat-containing protein [Cyclobacteriaceae bacterium]HRW98247.1 pentapeptide repeat-containing protein [Cyclobacteriaceae bacterium]